MILYGGGVAAAKEGGRSITVSESGGGGVVSPAPVVLKKGPWTAAEDEILAAYVREHGEGNWNAVQKNAGLARCGKSCRLRWANHLRPNLKKGAFTADEERLIIQLHAQLGNKWARMAAQLPGRTDNEIKNFWNTRLKRFQRQGLPLYPPDIIPTHQLHRQPQPQTQTHYQHNQQMYLQPLSPQPATSPSPLPSPTPSTAAANAAGTAEAMPSSSFTFQTITTATAPPATNTNNLLCTPHSPTPCPSPTTPQPPSPLLSSTPPISPHLQVMTLPLFLFPGSSSSCINHNNNSNSNNNNNNDGFTFPKPPPLLKQPSLRFKRCFNGDIKTSLPNIVPLANSLNNPGNGGGVFTTPPISPLAKSFYTSFLTLPYSSPATPTGATSYPSNSNEPMASFFSLNPSNFSATSSSPNQTQTQAYFLSSLQSSNNVFSVRPELPSSQTSPSNAVGFFDINNFTENEKRNQDATNTGLSRSSCELLEDILEEAEALADVVHPHKRRHLTHVAEDNNSSKNNNNNNVPLGSFGQCGFPDSIVSKPKEDESLQMNAMQEDLAKLLDWGSDSGEISNGHSSVVTDDNLVIDVHRLLYPVDSTAAATKPGQHNRNNASCSWDNLSGIC